jgi:hypothetical protein
VGKFEIYIVSIYILGAEVRISHFRIATGFRGSAQSTIMSFDIVFNVGVRSKWKVYKESWTHIEESFERH